MNPLMDFQYDHSELSGIRWVRRDLLHITLYFFGEIPVEMADNLVSLIQIGCKEFSPFTLSFEQYCYAPPRKAPRMIWARYQKHQVFKEMAVRLHSLFLQIRPDQQFRKSPIPHITLARLREVDQQSIIFPSTRLADLEVDQLILWESFLSPSGPEYEEIERFHLK